MPPRFTLAVVPLLAHCSLAALPGLAGCNLCGVRCVVTGASSGLGLDVAWGLASAGAHVEMACRDLRRCEEARQRLLMRCLEADGSAASRSVCSEILARCSCAQLDLVDPVSIRTFAESVCSTTQPGKRIVLINNAGVMGVPRLMRPREGPAPVEDVLLDGHLWPNHLGHFLLARLLLPAMAVGSCVIVVSSRAHYQGRLRFRADGAIDMDVGGGHWYRRYARSKLCNVLFAAEWRRRFLNGPACAAVSPGRVATGIFRGVPRPFRNLLEFLSKHWYQAPEEGAMHVLNLVSHALGSGDSADIPLYSHLGRSQKPSAVAEDIVLAAELWSASEAAVGLL